MVQNPIGLVLAVLLSPAASCPAHFYRTAIFLPTMLSVVIIGFTWQLILNPLWGIRRTLLGAVGLGGCSRRGSARKSTR